MFDAASTPALATRFILQPLAAADAPAVGRLYQQAIPQAIFARLGDQFTARFLSWIHAQPRSHVWAAHDERGQIAGMIAGSLDRDADYARIVAGHRCEIAWRVLCRLHRPSVLAWLAAAAAGALARRPAAFRTAPAPSAELLAIAVAPAARGSGLAAALVEAMESQFLAWGHARPYKILTRADNARANAFYQRLGARLAAQCRTRGMLINEYHKTPGQHGQNGHSGV